MTLQEKADKSNALRDEILNILERSFNDGESYQGPLYPLLHMVESEIKSHVEPLQKENERLEKEWKEMHIKFHETNDRIDLLDENNEQLESERDKLKSENKDLKHQLVQITESREEWKKIALDATSEITRLKEEVSIKDRLVNELNSAIAEIDSLKEQLKALTGKSKEPPF